MDFLKYLDLCRICLSDDGASIPIFSSITGEKTDLSEKLAVCFGEQILDLYGYPRNICKSCNTKVNDTVDFVNKFKESHKVLEKAFTYTIKPEINDYSNHVENLDDSFDYKGVNNIKIDTVSNQEHIQPTNNKAETKNKKKGKSNKNKAVSKKDVVAKKKIKIQNNSNEQLRRDLAKRSNQNQSADPIPSNCPICQKSFNNLKRHLARVHGDKKYVCTECGKTFALAHVLRVHNEHVHLKMRKRVSCKVCERQFCNAKTLLMHERSAHTGERPAVCSVCGKRFIHDRYLNDHMRTHTGEKPYKCPICGLGHSQRGNMTSHIKHNHRLSDIDDSTLNNIHPRFLKYMKT